MGGMYLASSLAWSESMTAILETAREQGASGVEIWAEQLWRNRDSPGPVRELAAKLGLGLTLHAPSWDLNLCSIDGRILQASRGRTTEAIELAALLGARIVVVHPGRVSLGGHFESYHWRELRQSYVELCSAAATSHITVGLEAMERLPKELLCTAAQVNRFVEWVRAEGVENLRVVVDLAHLTTISGNPVVALEAFDSVAELHVSNVKGGQLHTPLDDGDLEYSGILPALPAGLPVVVEGLSDARGFTHLKRSAAAYRTAAGRPS